MSRSEGFAVMDVSTSIADDPKFRRLQREHPDHVSAAFMAYIAMLGESWKAGRRVSVIDAWPVLLPFDTAIVDAMKSAGLIDTRGLPPSKAWAGWFGPASERRAMARARWARANENRHAEATRSERGDIADTSRLPRGNSAATAAIPSVPSVRPVPPGPSARNGATKTPQEAGATRGGDPVSLKDAVAAYGYKRTDDAR